MKVLVIPEDFRKDQYVVGPIISALMKDMGKSKARVVVCKDPLLGGVEQALRWDRIKEIIERYRGMVDLFILCVDRDGEPGRRHQLDTIEKNAMDFLGKTGRFFVAENAWQELEVWVLAGHELPVSWRWANVRQEREAKETYFEPFAKERGVDGEPGGGRKTLALEAVRNFPRIVRLCPEDMGNLRTRIRSWLQGCRD
ncbi:MAG: hypothetical protein GXP48_04095 [Acidobacteria bacterium]|nr:hypothetical protein [Acidobacteriota bacterium]